MESMLAACLPVIVTSLVLGAVSPNSQGTFRGPGWVSLGSIFPSILGKFGTMGNARGLGVAASSPSVKKSFLAMVGRWVRVDNLSASTCSVRKVFEE